MSSPTSSPSPPSTMPFHRRQMSDRNVPNAAPVRHTPSEQERNMLDNRQLMTLPSSMRGMRRLEIRRGMEESHYLNQQRAMRVKRTAHPLDMRSLDYVTDYDSNLMCPICRCPFVDPVVLNDCDHCFCRDCLIQTWTEYQPGGPRGNCPTCRTQTRLAAKGAVSKILVNILDDLLVKCPKHEDGCHMQVKRGEVQNHINLYCSYALVECPKENCDQSVRRKDASQCLHSAVACIDCHEDMFVADLEVSIVSIHVHLNFIPLSTRCSVSCYASYYSLVSSKKSCP